MGQFAIPNSSVVKLLDWMIAADTGAVEELALRLYTNDVTPTRSSVTSDFTEATFGGYGQRLLPRSGYGVPTIEANTARLTLVGDPLQWDPTSSGEIIRGCFIVGVGSNDLYAARKFASEREVVAGVALRMFPVWTLLTPEVES